jgi:hypothetical protein
MEGAKQENCSFDAYVQRLPYKALWKSVVTKLKTLKHENKTLVVANE